MTGACRTSDGGAGTFLEDRRFDLTQEECEDRCITTYMECTAMEYNTDSQSCEIHAEVITTAEEGTDPNTLCKMRPTRHMHLVNTDFEDTAYGDPVTSWGVWANTLTGRAPIRERGGYSPDAGGYLSFDRDNEQYYWKPGSIEWRMHINGNGFTVLALVRFRGTAEDSECIFHFTELSSNTDFSIALHRDGTTDAIRFVIEDAWGDGTGSVDLSKTGTIVQNEWAVFGVRYNDTTGKAELFKDGEMIYSETWTTGIVDRLLENCYIAKSREHLGGTSNIVYFNGDIGALYISDAPLPDSQMDFSFLKANFNVSAVEKQFTEEYAMYNYNNGDSVSDLGNGFTTSTTISNQPRYYSSGGYHADRGYFNFDVNDGTGRIYTQFPKGLNISSNGGWTMIWLIQFATFHSDARWIRLNDPTDGSIYYRIHYDTGNTDGKNFELDFTNYQGAGTHNQQIVECDLGISLDTWYMLAVRFNAITGKVEFIKDGTVTCSEYLPTGSTDGVHNIPATYATIPMNFNGKLSGFYLTDQWITDTQLNLFPNALTNAPTTMPTSLPPTSPTPNPTPQPTENPTPNPTSQPTENPTPNPTPQPTETVNPQQNYIPKYIQVPTNTTNPEEEKRKKKKWETQRFVKKIKGDVRENFKKITEKSETKSIQFKEKTLKLKKDMKGKIKKKFLEVKKTCQT